MERGDLSGDRVPVIPATSNAASVRACQRQPFDRVPRLSAVRPCDRVPVYPATSNAPRPVSISGNAATVRQSQAVATVRADSPPVYPARIPASRGERAATVPACLQSAATVCRIRRNIERGKDSGNAAPVATIERAAPIPANVAGYCPPSVQPCAACQRFDRPRRIPANVCRIPPAVRSTVARSPCNRGNRSTLARLNRAENGLASRPPLRPCPRPSEMRRALCKPSATVCNAISASRPQPWRTWNAATVRNRSRRRIRRQHRTRRADSSPIYPPATIERGDRAPPVSGSPVPASVRQRRNRSRRATVPACLQSAATVCQSIRQAATVRPCAACQRQPSAPQSPETRRNRPPLRFSAPDGFRARPAVPRPCKAVLRALQASANPARIPATSNAANVPRPATVKQTVLITGIPSRADCFRRGAVVPCRRIRRHHRTRQASGKDSGDRVPRPASRFWQDVAGERAAPVPPPFRVSPAFPAYIAAFPASRFRLIPYNFRLIPPFAPFGFFRPDYLRPFRRSLGYSALISANLAYQQAEIFAPFAACLRLPVFARGAAFAVFSA